MLALIGISNAQTLPSGTVYYQNITIGSWSGASTQYVQQMVNLTENNYYSFVYNGNQANFEFTYANGTVVPAWIESNNSGVLTIWLNITNTTTNVYLDIFNSTTNTLSSSGTSGIGEAPQLSSTYAEYDDGASVFNNYWNFAGTTLPSGWSTEIPSGATITQNNGITFTTDSSVGYVGITYTTGIPSPVVLEGDVTSLSGVAEGLAEQASSACNTEMYIFNGWTGGYEGYSSSTSQGMCAGFSSLSTSFVFGTSIEGLVWYSNSGQTWYNNYNSYTTSSTGAGNLPADIYPSIGIYQTSPSTSITYQWLRTRAYPPNGVMPTTTFGTVQSVYTPPTVSVSPTSQTLDIPQSITLTATVSGGTSPYTYQWYNDTTTLSAISGATSSTYTVVSGATGTFEYFVSVTDAHPTTVNSTNVTIVVNSALLANPITPASPVIDNGQSITLTANPSGGTTPYTYQWYSGTSSTCSSDTAISGATSSTYTASPTSSTYYCYTVNDSATTPETNTSATDFITVNPALTATISPVSTNTYTYLTTTLTVNASGGTSPYSYQWYNDTSGTPTAISGATSSTYNVAFASAGTYVFFANVKDSSQGTPTASVNTSNATINVSLAFTQLTIAPLNQSTIYPNPPIFYVNATDMANDTITLNITINGVSYFNGSILNSTNTTINASNSSFTIGNLGAGTYTAIFNASDALGAYILNQTNFTISQATPTSLQILFPNNSSTYTTTYNNQNITASYSLILPYSANNTNINPTLYLNGIAVQSIALYSQTIPSQFSNSYVQSGINLTAGTYNYVLNTTANQNYTASSTSGTVTINPASPILYLTVPANFTWNNSNGTIAFGVSDINNQVLANLELNYTPLSYLNSPYNSTVANTTTNSTYNVSTAGIYNTTVYSLATANYTANSTNVIWQISQTQGNTTLLLNGTNSNYTINDYQTIPINITSTDIGSTNITLYINGTEVFSGIANSTYNYTPELTCQTINNTQSVCGTFNITAVSSNINYTNTTQTWYLTVFSPYSNITLVQPYEYFGLYNQIYNTSNQIYALLNYTYNVSYLAEYNLTNITMSFGNSNSTTLNASNATGYANPFYNIYANNSNINYTIWINATDIYNNTYDVPINITTQISIPPAVTAPLVELVQNGITLTQTYSWTSPYTTTFVFNASAGNFPIVNTTVNFGDGSSPYVIPPYNGTQQEAVVHTFLNNGTYNVTVFTTAISGLNSTVNSTIVTVQPYIAPKITLETQQGYIHNQSYLFNFTQGTFTGSYVVINWGDGSSSTYLFQQGGVTQQFLLYHYYTIPSTYILQATVYDSQGLKNSGALIDPNLTISSFTYPSVVSISPNEPWNGANYQSNSYNITLVEGSYPIANLTINWEDSYLGSNPIQVIDLSNDSSGGIIYGIQHTFPFMSSYPVQTTICDIYDDCYMQVMPITLGISGVGNPYLQQQFNNETAMEMLIQEINSNPKIQYDRNPMPILYAIFFIGAVLISFTIIILYRLFKRKRVKR